MGFSVKKECIYDHDLMLALISQEDNLNLCLIQGSQKFYLEAYEQKLLPTLQDLLQRSTAQYAICHFVIIVIIHVAIIGLFSHKACGLYH